MRTFLAMLLVFACVSSQALIVNRLNGSAAITYIDFSIPGAVLPLELARTYNSITAASEKKGWLGAFGWGWTAPFETTLTTTPDRHVLLRDGANGNTVIFRPEHEDPKVMNEFLEAVKNAYTKKEGTKPAERLLKRLRTDPDLRTEMAAKYSIQATIPLGQVLVSSEFGYQTVHQKNKQWIRTREGMTQIFDNDGRLVKQVDKNGFAFVFTYSASQKFQLEQISDAHRTMSLKFKWRNDRVIDVVDNRGNRSHYNYDATGNLVQVTDSNRQIFKYSYDYKKFPHLLTRIDYISESKANQPVYREISYDENALVTYHRDKDGSETHFTYGKIAKDPQNNFWTKSVRITQGNKEETYDEFLIKSRPDGTKYLYRQQSRSGRTLMTTVFTACCGKPMEVTKNGVTTAYKYYPDGLLKERIGPKEDIKIEYDPRWKKVSRVSQNGLVSEYKYDEKGNLVRASNSRKQNVALKYDKVGRILEMMDTSGKAIRFKYGDLGKPVLISEAGVGSIRIAYDSNGKIRNAETLTDKPARKPSQDSREVVRRVMREFQTLLDIIRPAGIGMNLG